MKVSSLSYQFIDVVKEKMESSCDNEESMEIEQAANELVGKDKLHMLRPSGNRPETSTPAAVGAAAAVTAAWVYTLDAVGRRPGKKYEDWTQTSAQVKEVAPGLNVARLLQMRGEVF